MTSLGGFIWRGDRWLEREVETARGERAPSEKGWLERISSVFISAVDQNCDKRVIRSSLNMFGSIIDIFIPKKNGVGGGFAFVQFKNEKQDAHLVSRNPEMTIGGRRVSLDWAGSLPGLDLRSHHFKFGAQVDGLLPLHRIRRASRLWIIQGRFHLRWEKLRRHCRGQTRTKMHYWGLVCLRGQSRDFLVSMGCLEKRRLSSFLMSNGVPGIGWIVVWWAKGRWLLVVLQW